MEFKRLSDKRNPFFSQVKDFLRQFQLVYLFKLHFETAHFCQFKV